MIKFRYRADLPVVRGMECKFRASYLNTPVPGRATKIECAGACRRTRPQWQFSYNARRAVVVADAAVCKACASAHEVIDSILHAIVAADQATQAKRENARKRWDKLARRYSHARQKAPEATAAEISVRERLQLLRVALEGQQSHQKERARRLLWELHAWCVEAGIETGPRTCNAEGPDEAILLIDFDE